MKDDVDTVIGFLDIPPYVTMVPPRLRRRNTFTEHAGRKSEVQLLESGISCLTSRI